MAGGYGPSLEKTPTWAVAIVCLVLLAVSILIEKIIHFVGHWLKKKRKNALYEALEKIKSELMLMGFISLLLTILQDPISGICVSKSVGASWHPCKDGEKESDSSDSDKGHRRLLWFLNARRSLAAENKDACAEQGKVPFVSKDAIHQLHIFIFVLALFHVLYCILTLALGTAKMRKWKAWEEETKTREYEFTHDRERFRFARDTTFGRRHLHFWAKSPILLRLVCFFRQFVTSITKVDYFTLRHGFILAHLAPESQIKFDFQTYIKRSLEEDFKVIVEISPIIWFFAVLFLLTNTHGWYPYYWMPFIPLVIILLVGAKLQMIITKLGLRIEDRGGVVKGTPVVQPGDDLFWFNMPRLILYLIHFVLFQNAFQLAFFSYSWYEFGFHNCFHSTTQDVVIRLVMGAVIQFICSYVTLPLYALVTQMGSTMRTSVFNEKVATGLTNWRRTAKKRAKHSQHSASVTPFSSRPATPSHGMSPVHLLHNYPKEVDSYSASPSRFDVDHRVREESPSPSSSPPRHDLMDSEDYNQQFHVSQDIADETQAPLPPWPPRSGPTQHEIDMSNLSSGTK